MDEEIEVDREDVECQGVIAYVDDDGDGVVELHLGLNGPCDGQLVMTPEQAMELAGWLRKAVASLDDSGASL